MSEIVNLLGHDAEVMGTPTREGGRLVCRVRCRVPVQLDVATSLSLKSQEREHTEDAPTENHRYNAQENEVLVIGVASSTSVDWHGTEMSLSLIHI